jgi:SAM-dependent methyltransferase
MATEWQNEIPALYSLHGLTNSVHVDLGCGSLPRNPLSAEKVIGVDVFVDPPYDIQAGKLDYKQVDTGANLPFETGQVDSASAFDFLEHIPRTDRLPSGESFNPFISIMNEIHRMLKPGGIFISLTPCFPSPSAFTDPTHVNFISEETHLYFAGPNFAKAKGYGFEGEFNIVEAAWSDWSGAIWDSFAGRNLDSIISQASKSKDKSQGLQKHLKQKLRKKLIGHTGETHFLWVLQKPEYNG